MTELYGVRDNDSFGVGVDNLEAAVMSQGWTDVKAVAPVECPGGSFVGFVVNDDWAAARTKWSGVKVERFVVVVLPCRHGGGNTRLSEKVECKFSLR